MMVKMGEKTIINLPGLKKHKGTLKMPSSTVVSPSHHPWISDWDSYLKFGTVKAYKWVFLTLWCDI